MSQPEKIQPTSRRQPPSKKWFERIHPVLHLLARLLIGWVFLQSGLDKLKYLEAFYTDALNYHILPSQLMYFYAVCLPWLEILTGLYLLLGLFVRFSASLGSALMLSFIVGISIALIRGDAVNCGCFVNGESTPVSSALLLRDIGLFLLSAYLVYRPQGKWTADCLLAQPSTISEKNATKPL